MNDELSTFLSPPKKCRGGGRVNDHKNDLKKNLPVTLHCLLFYHKGFLTRCEAGQPGLHCDAAASMHNVPPCRKKLHGSLQQTGLSLFTLKEDVCCLRLSRQRAGRSPACSAKRSPAAAKERQQVAAGHPPPASRLSSSLAPP